MTKPKEPPMTPEEVQKRIREGIDNGTLRIEPAPQVAITELSLYVDKILDALEEVAGVQATFVSDDSCLTDFIPREEREEGTIALSKMLGVPIDLKDENDNFIVKLAHRLKQRSLS